MTTTSASNPWQNHPAGFVEIRGARTHNLRDVSVRIPRGVVVAFTGVSGSGKTSLAIDTIHAEAQLRYLEGLSPFVRQYISVRDRPKVDRITGLGVTLAVDQRKLNRNPRSTVATLTGVDGYLGLLFSRLPGLVGLADPVAGDLTAAHFDRYSPEGRCPGCHGMGGLLRAAPELIITRPELPLTEGASPWFGKWRSNEHAVVPALAAKRGVDLGLPWQELPESFRHEVLHGTGDEVIEANATVAMRKEDSEVTFSWRQPMRGALADVERLYGAAGTESAKQRYAKYMKMLPCTVCGGSGLGEAAQSVTLGGVSYEQIVDHEIRDVQRWSADLPERLDAAQREVGGPLLQELDKRLRLLDRLGLAHVQLGRSAMSLSGGELQRTRLAAQLGTDLTGVLFVLDEPGAGLHPADKSHLVDITAELRDAGNTVLLVEHDPELVARADWVVDIGPGAGRLGGGLVACGTPAEVAAVPESVTGQYLRGHGTRVSRTPRPVDASARWLSLRGVKVHNVDVEEVQVPLGRLTCFTGVSGSGKSSLLHEALGEGVRTALAGETCDAVRSVDPAGIAWVAVVDQEPIGRTPRSNPATYTKAFDQIRALFAGTAGAEDRGLSASSFSFNAAGGRCEDCTGYGRRLVNMHFLPDVWVMCQTCDGKRFKPEVLEVTYQGLTIDDVLGMTVEEAAEHFTAPAALAGILTALRRVGLGYLQLGQSATELSGGEAQRLKLATAIHRGSTGRSPGLIVLDEPVSGLHPADVQRMVDAFDLLLDAGNTVVVAEHDLHVAAAADWLVDLGPGAGGAGGRVVAEGTPEQVRGADTPTAGYLRRIVESRPLLDLPG
ncbi:excinuclease ABC subunit UvrA [Saccharothrix deserti]|uniref:excinuclease ABC subunit UvrA n=1 Tax=Saccharothrix deserti TaxID=2593674 RepID=UPI001EE48355|nr:excinuclease ABC subunit UvrA [Saccharothrix deserti]